MSQDGKGNKIFGIILIVVPIIALIFGSNEPAMQTDQAAIVMTGMIFFGIIMLASGSKKRSQPISSSPNYHVPVAQVSNEPFAYCPYCGSEVTTERTQYCTSCGRLLQSVTSTQHHGFSSQ